MARCPFAIWTPISGSSGPYVGGPFRIVHHTSEGSSASEAMAVYRAARADPHFTVDWTTIFQHIDTDEGARALRHHDGMHTNRLSAVQIEVVGFAGQRKSKAALVNLARLCRWIEVTHNVPRIWPAGPPKPPTAAGGDPGGHNRSAATWTSSGGHYGHSQVPENVQWDPAYVQMEVDFLMNAGFDAAGTLSNAADPKVRPFVRSTIGPAMPIAPAEVIEDHFDVGEAQE